MSKSKESVIYIREDQLLFGPAGSLDVNDHSRVSVINRHRTIDLDSNYDYVRYIESSIYDELQEEHNQLKDDFQKTSKIKSELSAKYHEATFDMIDLNAQLEIAIEALKVAASPYSSEHKERVAKEVLTKLGYRKEDNQ